MTQNKKKVIHNIKTEVDDFGRKKYRLQETQQNDEELNQIIQQQNKNDALIDTGRYKSMLIGREQNLNIDKYIGRLQTNKKKKITEVFYCDICKEGFKCDMAFITHTNSPAHNRKLGMNMKVKGISVDAIADKIKSLREKKMEKSGITNQVDQLAEKYQQDSEDQSNNQQNDQENQKRVKVKKVKQEQQNVKNQPQNQPQQQEQQDNQEQQAELNLMKAMGLPTSFGSKKRKY